MPQIAGTNSGISRRVQRFLHQNGTQTIDLNLLTTNSRNKKLQKAISVHVNADFRVRRDLIDALNDVTVSVKNVALHFSVTIPYRFPARELTPGLDVDVHLLHLDQSRIDRH